MSEDPVVESLREKYGELRRLRMAESEGDPRAALRALSARFPGSLRELDRLPMHVIDVRLDLLASMRAPAPWCLWMARYHALLRLAQRVRRAVLPERETTRAGRIWAALGEPALDEALLREILAPPGGRLHRWAVSRVAAEHGVSARDVERVLLPEDA